MWSALGGVLEMGVPDGDGAVLGSIGSILRMHVLSFPPLDLSLLPLTEPVVSTIHQR